MTMDKINRWIIAANGSVGIAGLFIDLYIMPVINLTVFFVGLKDLLKDD